jgi:uncharacterized YigZ family protein
MMARYPIPAREARKEIIVVNSRFIVSLAPTFNVEEAMDFISRIKTEFPDASHHVPAYLIGFGTSVIAHCSDAGEPTGTAGRPALAVLQGSSLGDVTVVVTRYFGGTKLGTGGLVHAYGQAVKEVLKDLPRAEKAPTYTIRLVFPYPYFENVRRLVSENKGKILDENFAADVTVTALLLVELFDGFQKDLGELTRGSIRAEIIETRSDTIIPLGSFR